METIEINKKLLNLLGFYLTDEFNRTTIKNMVALYGIYNTLPRLHKTKDGTYLYGNVGLELHQVDGFKPHYVLSIACMFKPKYGKEFNHKYVTLIKVTEFINVETTKKAIKEAIRDFQESIK